MKKDVDGHIDADGTMTSADIAEKVFRRRVQWWYKHRRKYIEEYNFPRPLNPDGPPITSSAQVLVWASLWQGPGKFHERKR